MPSNDLKHFILLGNGGGGTSLLRGLLNAHPQIECYFEHKLGPGRQDEELQSWIELSQESEKKGLIFGNKIPIEQFITRQYSDEQIIRLIDHFHIIWIARRFSRYFKGTNKGEYLENWKWGRALYWEMREKSPEKIIEVSFEDLLLRTDDELIRLCFFLGVDYDEIMMEGTKDTGHGSYNFGCINLDKL